MLECWTVWEWGQRRLNLAEWLPGVGRYQARMDEEGKTHNQPEGWGMRECGLLLRSILYKPQSIKKEKKDTLGLIVIPLACEATDTKYNWITL